MTVRDAQASDMSGMAAYYKDPAPYPVTCACKAERACEPGWFSAGCPFHGVTSMVGQWEYMKEAEDFRLALMPGSRKSKFNVKWGD